MMLARASCMNRVKFRQQHNALLLVRVGARNYSAHGSV